MPSAEVIPYGPDFPELLRSYLTEINKAVRSNYHHDQRRYLLMNFLQQAYGIKVEDVVLEKKIKASQVRGRIDAFFRDLIIEIKTNMEQEREDAQIELVKYFTSQKKPERYVAAVTDGLLVEVYIYDKGSVRIITTFTIDEIDVARTYRLLDQLLFSGTKVIPSSADIVVRFGLDSTVYNTAYLQLEKLFELAKSTPSTSVKFIEWNRLLARVYGSSLGNVNLFLKHTYLTMFSRLIVARCLFAFGKAQSDFSGIIDGSYFKQRRLENLAEPDFFSWAIGTPAEAQFVRFIGELSDRLSIYDLVALSEDVLKELYQELIDPEDRHDLGEYYTPDWLADLVLERIGYRGGRLLDPACGSGTFLFVAIRALRRTGLKGAKLVHRALSGVIGLDVHPVAVLMAKANILLALRNDLQEVNEAIYLPIYMADTLMTGEDTKNGILTVPVSKTEIFNIPFATINRGQIDALLDKLFELAKHAALSQIKYVLAVKGVVKHLETLKGDAIERTFWLANFRLMVKLEKENRNSIWGYILKNAHRPIFLRSNPVDYVVGNPPWLSYRFIKDPAYQLQVKRLTYAYKLLDKREQNLVSQMETATLFYAHCVANYLKKDGCISFVMPKSVMLPAKQHRGFQQSHRFTEIHDLVDVTPVFNVPSCVMIGDAKAKGCVLLSWSGTIPGRNATLPVARPFLSFKKAPFIFLTHDHEPSPYWAHFLQGATLVPISCWFVEPEDDSPVDAKCPYLKTSAYAESQSKKPYKFKLTGRIEADFLFSTVKAADLVPFGAQPALIFLPLRVERDRRLHVVDDSTVLSDGASNAATWLGKAVRKWEQHRKDKSMSLYDRIDYQKTLSSQSLAARYVVIYNQSGTHLCATVIDQTTISLIGAITTNGFIADSKTYYSYAKSAEEAYYLVAFLNSPYVNDAIKPFMTQGLLGERDIHRRPFEVVQIPQFAPSNEMHRLLAKIASAATEKVSEATSMTGTTGSIRNKVRDLVQAEISEINDLVRKTLSLSKSPHSKKKETPHDEFSF